MRVKKISVVLCLCAHHLYAVPFNVTVTSDSVGAPAPTSLRAALNDPTTTSITIDPSIQSQIITLAGPLPPIRQAGFTSFTGPITIDGATLYPALAVAVGTGITLNQLTFQNTNSIGGAGGSGFSGGGGGAGGGGGLHIHQGVTVTAIDCKFITNKATGGAGGTGIAVGTLGSGGGGGGYGGGAGGNGGSAVAGGGGGGHAGGGAGGNSGTPAGTAAVVVTYSGGGGGAGIAGGTGGDSGASPVFAGAAFVAGAGGGGGGGAGASPPAPVTSGGQGGDGIPLVAGLSNYGTGGGGGGVSGATPKNGGQGFGTSTGSGGGGGGGGVLALPGVTTGGAGGLLGGGGGGGGATGGAGGVGGGGGGGTVAGTSVFGGGSGGTITTAPGGAGGGGGAGLGGGVFIQQGGSLTITESSAGTFSLQGNTTVAGAAGAAGASGATAGAAGKNLGDDFFITSTGLLTLNLLEDFSISTNIDSNQCLGTGCTPSSGLAVSLPAGKTLSLLGTNTYTGTTSIASGIVKVNADTGLGAATTTVTFPVGSTGTLQAGGTITSTRGINLDGPGILDTPTGTSMSFSGTVTGAGKLTKIGPGSLELSGTNNYSGGTDVLAGILIFGGSSNSPLGTGEVRLFDSTTLRVGSDFTGAGTIGNTLTFVSPQNGQTTIDAQGNAKWGGLVQNSAPADTAPFIKTGPGTFTLTNAANTFTGTININGGTLGATSNGALGNAANQIFINNATFQAAASFATPRPINLTGSSNIEVLPTFTLVSNGVISGSGSLTKTNTGILRLDPQPAGTANLYLGGTNIAGGTLQIFADSALGDPGGSLTIQTATLQTLANISSARAISISGAAIIDTGPFQDTLSGVMSGTGASVEKRGTGTLILTGNNTYAGTFIITAGILQGNSSSLKGNIEDNATLIFDQTFDGVYAGSISKNGIFIKQGGGKLQLSGNSSGFQGPVSINGGNLDVTGTLGGSNTITINAGGTLSGTGTVANVVANSGGALSPGDPTGILSINGTLTFNNGSSLDAHITPTTGGLGSVASTTTIQSGAKVTVIPDTSTGGFFGVKAAYTILRGPTILGQFGSVTSTNPNFIPTLSYPTIFDANGNKLYSTVQLNVTITQPFLGYSAGNKNEQAVANNINALGAAGTLLSDTPLFRALETLTGQTTAIINAALDQMHPAQMSAMVELQNEVSAQLLSLFHRRPSPGCYCQNPIRVWIEPYGNWLQEKRKGMQIGFNSRTQGVALGFDGKVLNNLVLGIGGSWDYKHLSWSLGRGKMGGNGWNLGVYSDYTTDHYYFGFSFLGGRNDFHAMRHIRFNTVVNTNPAEVVTDVTDLTPVNVKARSDIDALNLVGQVSTAFMFGPSKCCLFPYINADVFYSDMGSFQESGAPGFNLSVKSTSSMTFRPEAGIGLQVQDSNYDETMCISPQVLLGWALETPIFREDYESRFEGQTIPFDVEGWNKTWQLFTVDFGLNLSYYCATFSGTYHLELHPDNHSSLFNQRCNFQFSYAW